MFSLAYKCFSIINDNKGVEWVEGGAVGEVATVGRSGGRGGWAAQEALVFRNRIFQFLRETNSQDSRYD